MGIKDLRRGLPVIGFAKIGEASPQNSPMKGAPYKFDHIEFTSRLRDSIGRLIPDKRLIERVLAQGGKTCGGCKRSEAMGYPEGLPTEFDIFLPYDDMELNFPTAWLYRIGSKRFCTGDGQAAMRLQKIGEERVKGRMVPKFGDPMPHPGCNWKCPDRIDRRCRVDAKLRFVLAVQENVGGVFEFRTSSTNSATNLIESLDLIMKASRRISQGAIAWVVPLRFEISEQSIVTRDDIKTTAWIARVTYPGGPKALAVEIHRNLQIQAPLVHEIRQLEACIADPGWEPPDELFDSEGREIEDAEFVDVSPAKPAPDAPEPAETASQAPPGGPDEPIPMGPGAETAGQAPQTGPEPAPAPEPAQAAEGGGEAATADETALGPQEPAGLPETCDDCGQEIVADTQRPSAEDPCVCGACGMPVEAPEPEAEPETATEPATIPAAWQAIGKGNPITKPQCGILRAKAQRRAIHLGLEHSGFTSILKNILRAGGAEHLEQVTTDCYDGLASLIEAYELPPPAAPAKGKPAEGEK